MLVTVASRGKPGTEHCRAHLHIRAQLHGKGSHELLVELPELRREAAERGLPNDDRERQPGAR